jgi:hypothetical protein
MKGKMKTWKRWLTIYCRERRLRMRLSSEVEGYTGAWNDIGIREGGEWKR